MVKLRVLLSTEGAYPPTTLCPVNGGPVPVRTKDFEGEISVFAKGYEGDGNAGDGSEFFTAHPDDTFAFVVRGRYLDGVNGDDLLFGNVFERPIRDSLPWGTAIATKFMYFVDPTLELDIYADKPWALSPVLSTMRTLSLKKAEGKEIEAPTAMGLFRAVDEDALRILDLPPTSKETAVRERRKFYGTPGNRERITFDPSLHTGMDFGSGVLDIPTLSVTLPNPFPFSISLANYWDGQPVTYVCRRRVGKDECPVKEEGMYWSIAFEIIDEDVKAALKKRGKEVLELPVKDSAMGKTVAGSTSRPTATTPGSAALSAAAGIAPDAVGPEGKKESDDALNDDID